MKIDLIALLVRLIIFKYLSIVINLFHLYLMDLFLKPMQRYLVQLICPELPVYININ